MFVCLFCFFLFFSRFPFSRHEYPNVRSLYDEDVDVHQFEKIEASPSLAVVKAPQLVQLLVKHMRAHRDAFYQAISSNEAEEMRTFWLRKTRKPVLCVLMIKCKHSSESGYNSQVVVQDGTHLFYRGINMEVSMPTGSLCAERNAISTALAADLSLTRSEFVMLGVLSVTIPTSDPPTPGKTPDTIALNPLAPCGACQEWLKKVSEVNPDFRVVTFTNTKCESVYVNSVE
eukprot:c18674_g1_i4.p1 GENE.c18674_g1_i4~~c18674_g1_i4.p1  ORF type:complete len:230 (+),score=55.54 c18674_g1_i4:298-987(+)